MTAPVFAASELAHRFGLALRGPDRDISGVGTLADATPQQLGFLANPRYRAQLAETQAAVVVLREEDATAFAGTALVARDPYVAFARISAPVRTVSRRANPASTPARWSTRRAVVSPARTSARSPASARARPSAPALVVIGPGCVIGEDCEIGEGCELQARVTLVTRVRLGKRVRILPGAVLGAAGFGLAMDARPLAQRPAAGRRGGRRRLRDRRQHLPSTAARWATPCSRKTCAWTTRSRSATTCASARTPRWPAVPPSPAARASAATA
jgi:UDP-3-O-[3-hydroxymyristoyl] glucosamine N-acyltransferase